MKKLSVLLLFWVFNVSAEIPKDVKHEVDLRIKHGHNPSIALGMFEKGKTAFYVKGWQNKEQQIPATKDTVYEIGSITKTFTGLLLAVFVEEHKVGLDAAVDALWNHAFELKDHTGQPINLKQLSTHTSGLPRLPSGFPLFADDPYSTYDRAALIDVLVKMKPGQADQKYAYSNFAVGLLGETLAVISGTSFNDLVQQKIISPLSLKSTFVSLNDVPKQHLAIGYTGDKPNVPWSFKALAGAGSLRSSVADLLSYGAAYLQPEGILKDAMKLATETHYQQDKIRIGLGWHLNGDIIWHNGGTGGFRSIVLINPKKQKVVAAITNDGHHDVEDLAVHLMDKQQAMRALDFPQEIDADRLNEFTGHYQQPQTELQIDIKLIDDQLYFTAPNQPKQAMFYVGNDSFKFKMLDVKISFKRDTNKAIDSLVLHGWGEPQVYQKNE